MFMFVFVLSSSRHRLLIEYLFIIFLLSRSEAPGRKALTLLLIFQFYSQCLFHSSDLIYNCWMIEPHCLPQGWELANELAVRGAISFRVCRSGQFCIILNKKALQVHICLSCLFICFSCFWLFLGLKWLSECPSYSKK